VKGGGFLISEKTVRNWRIQVPAETLKANNLGTRVKKPTIIETIRLNRLRWLGHVQRMEENRIPKRVLYMNLVLASLHSSN
jgi:hypothetical protein